MVDTQKKKELLPCPFCGCEATLVVDCFEDDHRYPREFWNAKVECDGCNATQGYSIVSSQEAKQEDINEKAVAEVIESWNQRAIIY